MSVLYVLSLNELLLKSYFIHKQSRKIVENDKSF